MLKSVLEAVLGCGACLLCTLNPQLCEDLKFWNGNVIPKCLGLGLGHRVWLLDCPSISQGTANPPRIKEIGRTVTEDGHLVLFVSYIRVQSPLQLKAKALWLRSFEKLPAQDRCKEKVPEKWHFDLIAFLEISHS